MSVTVEMNLDSLMEAIGVLSLADKWRIIEQTQKMVKKESKKSVKKSAKKSDDSESGEPKEKKEPNAWIKHTQHVRAHLKTLSETDALAKKATAVTQVAKMLKDEDKLFPSEEDVMDAFARWKADPPAPKEKVAKEKKPKKEKKVKSDSASASASTASSESESESAEAAEPKPEKKKRAPQSEETKAAAKVKRAATKAKKAAAAAESAPESAAEPVEGVAEPVEAVAAVEAAAVEPDEEVAVVKIYNLGKGAKKYDTFKGPKTGTEYLFDNATDAYIGLYNPDKKKLDTTVPDPTLA